MEIEIKGGKDEIGGNKIFISHQDTNIVLDFGMSFKQSEIYYSEFLQPRKCTALLDFFEMELLPDLKGVYRQDYLNHMDRPSEDRCIDALFLSHAHFDHSAYVHFLRKDIPICCSEETTIILQCLEKTSVTSFKDFITVCDAFTFYQTRNKEYVHDRPYNILTQNGRTEVGSLEIEMVPVDHSLPGACAYIIYSDEGNLVYTGDIRFHGSNKDLSDDFVEKAKEARPRWLLCEGTRIDKDTSVSEQDVQNTIANYIGNTEGLAIVEHPIRDTDRVHTIYKSTIENNREFVIPLKLAYLLDLLGDKAPFSTNDVKIWIPKKEWGLIGRDDVEEYQISKDYDTWERDYIVKDNAITFEQLKEETHNFVVSMNFFEIKNLIDIQPKNATWIMSKCEPFSDDMKLDEKQKMNWLNYFNIEHKKAHASGHAAGPEIRKMISEINPSELMPIHTEHPELF
jgi:ribonuclease J